MQILPRGQILVIVMNRILDTLIPRFITEDVALIYGDDGDLYPLCALSDLGDSEHCDAIGTFRSFNLFGFALFPEMISMED